MKRALVLMLAIITMAAAFLWFREWRRSSDLLERERVLMEGARPSMSLAETEGATRFRGRDRDVSTVPDDRAIIAAAEGIERSEWPDAVDPLAVRFIEDMLKLDGDARMTLFLRIKNNSEVGGKAKNELLSTLLRASADSNPKMVLRLLRESPELLPSGRDAGSIAMRSWGRTDPYGALDWMRRMKDRPDLVTPAMKSALVAGAGSVDVALGFKMLAELGDYGSDAARGLAQQAETPEDRTAVLTEMRKVAATLEPSMERTRLENRITIPLLDKAVKDGFRNGSRWIAEAGFSKESLGSSPVFDYRKMKSGEIGDWIEWIGVHFQPEAGKATISNLVTDWSKADYQSTALWLERTNPGSTRDTAIGSFLTSVAASNPDEARKWAMTMPDDAERKKAMDLIATIVSETGGNN